MKRKKSNHKKHGASSINNPSTLEKLINSSLLALATTMAISIALLLISTGVAITFPDSLALIEPIGYVSLFVSAFLGGFASSKLNKRSPYITSLLCGVSFIILSMLISIALPHSLASGMDIITRLLIHSFSFLTFPIGALVGVKATKPQKRRKRR